LLVALLGLPRAAHAQTDPAAAETLFRQGRALSDAGDVEGACAKFRESARLDPAIGTTFNIADCEERLGHLARAWTLFGEVVQRLPPTDKRHDVAKKRAAALEPRLPKLSVRLAANAPASARVTRDGVELGPASLGTPLPVDPGEHLVVVSAPGHADQRFKLLISEREIRILDADVGPLEPKRVDEPPLGRAPVDQQLPPSHSISPPPRSPVLGYAIGGIGVAGFVTGAIAGALVLQKKHVVDQHCGATKLCDDEGYQASKSGKTLGIVTTAGLLTGAIGVGTGAFLILHASTPGDPRASSISLQGRF
jgi:hypothetical protein